MELNGLVQALSKAKKEIRIAQKALRALQRSQAVNQARPRPPTPPGRVRTTRSRSGQENDSSVHPTNIDGVQELTKIPGIGQGTALVMCKYGVSSLRDVAKLRNNTTLVEAIVKDVGGPVMTKQHLQGIIRKVRTGAIQGTHPCRICTRSFVTEAGMKKHFATCRVKNALRVADFEEEA